MAAVILDEVHERHLDTDLALAYLRTLQKKRPELKLVLMSATLDTEITKNFTAAKLWDISAKHFDIKTSFLPNQPSILNQSLEQKVNAALKECTGPDHVLVFLPGMREIQRVHEAIGEKYGKVFYLHGELEKDEQTRALEVSETKKIILATNVAESSLTIPGVRTVIDSGIQREAVYSVWNGLKTLQDRKITQSSAIQREGRAGREAPGRCFRLYSEQDYQGRQVATIPELLRADLTDTYLLSLKLNQEFDWIIPPPPSRWEGAKKLSEKLGASFQEKLTDVGRKMSSYPVEARLARILVAGEALSLNEKKKLVQYISEEIEEDRSGRLRRRLSSFLTEGKSTETFEKAILYGFIDQVALFRLKQHDFIHASGKTFKAHPSLKALEDGHYIVVDITQRQEVIKVLPIEEDWLYDVEPFPLTEDVSLRLENGFKLSSQVKLGSLVIESEDRALDYHTITEGLRSKVHQLGQKKLNEELEKFKDADPYGQILFLSKQMGKSISSEFLFQDYIETYQTLAFTHLDEFFRQSYFTQLGISSLNDLPLTVNLGGRSPLRIHYPSSEDPYIEAPIQDFFGQTSTPTILGGKIALTLKLVGPHKRPVQVTKDLKGFWDKVYPDLKKEFQRDYPRHHWPENPLTAKPVLLKRML